MKQGGREQTKLGKKLEIRKTESYKLLLGIQ